MAKSIGLVGTLSGKAGNFVFCKGSNGRTVVRPYQPQVYNPKSPAQTLQRSKMVLAGMLSSIASSALLVSMNKGRKVDNRAAFVKNILRKAATDPDTNSVIADILGEEIVFGQGSVPAHVDFTNSYVAAADGKFTFSLTPLGVTDDMVGKIGYRCIVVTSRKQGELTFDAIDYVDAMVSSKSAALEVQVPLTAAQIGSSYVAGYIVPFELTEEAASQFGNGGYFDPSSNRLCAILATSPSLVKDWGDSRILDDFFLYTGE